MFESNVSRRRFALIKGAAVVEIEKVVAEVVMGTVVEGKRGLANVDVVESVVNKERLVVGKVPGKVVSPCLRRFMVVVVKKTGADVVGKLLVDD